MIPRHRGEDHPDSMYTIRSELTGKKTIGKKSQYFNAPLLSYDPCADKNNYYQQLTYPCSLNKDFNNVCKVFVYRKDVAQMYGS